LKAKDSGIAQNTDDILFAVTKFRKSIDLEIQDIKKLVLAAKAGSRREPDLPGF
jgi:hypothetical protein